jgi:Xaa-Pro aminopeptidase
MQSNIPTKELSFRRQNLLDNMPENSTAIFLSNQKVFRNSDVDYNFRQDSNFWYFAGINSEDCAIIFKKTNNEESVVIYGPRSSAYNDMWNGKSIRPEEIKNISGIEDIKFFDEFENDFGDLFKGAEKVYFDFGEGSYRNLRSNIFDYLSNNTRRSSLESLTTVHKTRLIVEPLRIIKSQYEVEQIRKAIDITVNSHRKMYKSMRSKIDMGDVVSEYNLDADLAWNYRNNKADWAYSSIVASGQNACTLHYNRNSDSLRYQDLVLVDSGCEVNYYASDITRCYPVSGKFSKEQKIVYEAVLKAQLSAIAEMSKPTCSNLSFHSSAVYSITESLIDMGILEGNLSENVRQKTYLKYFMHGTGHFMGLDVHDLGPYKDANGKPQEILLRPGMVLTVEPGLYFAIDDMEIPKEYRGIGIRIEDNVLITAQGAEVLSEDLEKTVEGIEGME